MLARGFTLAELLIALLILGVIATFTIPKVLVSQQNAQYQAAAKEVAAMLSGAFQAYRSEKGITQDTSASDFSAYMNYVATDNSTTIDLFQTTGTRQCGTSGGYYCLKLHNGGMLMYSDAPFGGTTSNRAMYFYFDPDGKVTDGTTNGPGKSVVFWIYANGRITSYSNVAAGTQDGWGDPITADPTYDPTWFSW